MDLKRLYTALLAATMLALPGTALAACTDQAAPKVDWRRCYFDGQDLSKIIAAGARMRDATFLRSTLDDADLSGVDAYHAKFISAHMTGIILIGADLGRTDFTKADLSGADLTGADLRGAILVEAHLNNANLTGVDLTGALLREADLSGATWTDGTRICKTPSIGRCN